MHLGFIFAAAEFLHTVTLVAAQSNTTLIVNTPAEVAQCEETLLTWNGAYPPFFATILPDGNPSANYIVYLGQTTETSIMWIPRLAVGAAYSLAIRDSTGAYAYSSIFAIQVGTNSSCMGTGVSSAVIIGATITRSAAFTTTIGNVTYTQIPIAAPTTYNEETTPMPTTSIIAPPTSVVWTTLDGAPTETAATPASSDHGPTSMGGIIGGVLGGLALLVLVAALVTIFLRKRRGHDRKRSIDLLNGGVHRPWRQEETGSTTPSSEAKDIPPEKWSKTPSDTTFPSGPSTPQTPTSAPDLSLQDSSLASPSPKPTNAPNGRPRIRVIPMEKVATASRSRTQTSASPSPARAGTHDYDLKVPLMASQSTSPSTPTSPDSLLTPTLSAAESNRLTDLQLQTIQALIARNIPADTLTAVLNSMLAGGSGSSQTPANIPDSAASAPPAYQER